MLLVAMPLFGMNVKASDNTIIEIPDLTPSEKAQLMLERAESYNNDTEGMILVAVYEKDIDDETCEVIEDYESPVMNTRATVKTKNAVRNYYIKNSKTGVIKVQFACHGVFSYTGTSAKCTYAYVNVYNHYQSQYTILNKSTEARNNWAYIHCAARNTIGKLFQKTVTIGIKNDGTIMRP